MGSKELLLKTLEELGEEDFSTFRWYLEQPDILDGLPSIPKSHLEDVKRTETVDKIVQTHGQQSEQVVKQILTKISRNDLAEKLSTISTEAQDVKSARVTCYRERLQSNLQVRFKFKQEGWRAKKDEKSLDDIYTKLCIIDGGETHTSRQIEMVSGRPAGPEISNIFTHPSGIKKNIRTALTVGEAGTGKTFLVHKFVLDWTERRTSQEVDLLFPFMFSELNSLREENQSFAKLIHTCIPESVHIKEEDLTSIFTTLRTSGNSDFEQSEYKLLFVLDGLDESRLQLDFTDDDVFNDVTKSTSVDVLLTNLIRGSLLPSARVWITTRPPAANQIPPDFTDIETEVRGFTETQREEYLRKRFRDEEQASRIISHIKTSPSLHFMCHIPVYCWVTATVLQEVLKSKEGGELPETLTEVYTELLNVQIRHLKQSYGTEKSLQCIKTLSKLAFNQLEKDSLIFSEEDLKEDSSSFTEVLMHSKMFSRFFKDELQLKEGRNKVFSFVHQSVVEFLAALFVLSDSDTKNMEAKSPKYLQLPAIFSKQTRLPQIYSSTVEKAVQRLGGHLDLFLRFLLGLSLQTNKSTLHDLLPQTGSSSQTTEVIVNYVRKKIRENPSPERRIRLFLCLNELKDGSPVEEIKYFLKSGTVSKDELSPAQWSALVFIILSSQKDLTVFDLKEYSASEKALLGLLPVFEASNKALLRGCNLSERSCDYLSSALSSPVCSVRELDLSNNNLQDSGVKLISAVLNNPHCKLQTVRLCDCKLSERSCDYLSSALSSPSCGLRQLDLRYNNLGVSGKKLHQSSTKTAVWTGKLSPKNIISRSAQISSGPPAVYQLRPKKEKFGALTRVTVGEKNPNQPNKTILLVGETGAGKSTLINALLNYSMGVKFVDEVWFQIVEEERRWTSDVIVYKIFGFEDESLPYSLTIIDTPGYGNTRGTELNGIISERLLDLFRSDDGVHEVHAVGLVMKATDNQQNDRLMYIFDSVMSLFGKDLEKNIVALITHSDGRTPKCVLEALEAAKIKCARNEKNQPVYFLFDNQHEDRTEEEENLKQADEISERGMREFTDCLEKTAPQKLKKTVEVLNKRVRLTACIQNLKEKIKLTELKQREIRQTERKQTEIRQIQEALKKHEEEMKNNEKLTVEIDEVYKDKEPIDGGIWWLFFYEGAVCCTFCEENCHYPGCTMAWKPENCEVMRGGRCTVCTEKCPPSDHVKEKWRYVTKTRRVQKTLREIKKMLERNKSESENKSSLLENLLKQMDKLTAERSKFLFESYQHVLRLEQIALKADSLSTFVHLDFLIEKMKEEGDTEKVQKLEEMRSRVDEGIRAALYRV